MASVRRTASQGAQRWNDQWWDFVKNGTPLTDEQRTAIAEMKQQQQARQNKTALQFIIVKSGRYIDEAQASPADAYAGPTCLKANVPPGKVYANFAAAQADAQKLTAHNPVGFEVLTLPVL